MKRWLKRPAAAMLAIAAGLATAALSQVPYRASIRDRALLRLSWRAAGERVQECRQATADELSRQPVHMRTEVICEGRVAPFRLRVEVDGERVIDEQIRASGAREDRPVYVFRERALLPGRHEVVVRFERVDQRGEVEERREGDAPFPRELGLSRSVTLRDGEIALITYDAERRALTLMQPATR
jgi:hypothetical protein